MLIRQAKPWDKDHILDFCQKTFSWGDYIELVWDFWHREGNLFVAIEKKPVGLCHSFLSKIQVWIEGIRIHPDYRRQKLASKLVLHSEFLAKQKSISDSFMLIDTKNSPSIFMAKSLGYSIFETWHFYSLKNKNSNFNVSFGNCLPNNVTHYVRSWRWIPLDEKIISQMEKNDQLVYSEREQLSFAILSPSDHFKDTLIVTLFSNSDSDTREILSYLQNLGMKKNLKIQILSQEDLPEFYGLEKKLSFNLMKKPLV